METLIYLYGVVPEAAPDPPADLTGVDQQPVRLLRISGLAAVISEVSAAEYGEAALNARLSDLAWVGERGLAHERVLTWYGDSATVIPLSPFSLHADEARVRQRIQQDVIRLHEILQRLAGRQEWGLKVWRVASQVLEHLEELSPRMRALAEELESAPPGRRFLLGKKRESLQQEELRSATALVLEEVIDTLRARAEAAARLPISQSAPEAERVLSLHAAFLVPAEGYSGFQRSISELAGKYQPLGFHFEFTGPWPPYHFVDLHAS